MIEDRKLNLSADARQPHGRFHVTAMMLGEKQVSIATSPGARGVFDVLGRSRHALSPTRSGRFFRDFSLNATDLSRFSN
jgi:hypothetical protein